MIAKLLGYWMLFTGLVFRGSFIFDYNPIKFFEETLGFSKLRALTMKVIQEPWGDPVLVGGPYEWEYPDKPHRSSNHIIFDTGAGSIKIEIPRDVIVNY